MRELEVTLGGRELRLAATFKASLEIAEKVGDPLTIMREATLEAMFLGRGIPYEPKWRFTVENTPLILFIGLKAAGEKVKLEEIQELVFEGGFIEAKDAASEYLALLVGPKPEESLDEEGTNSGN